LVEKDIQQQQRAADGKPDDKYVPTVTRDRRITARTFYKHDPLPAEDSSDEAYEDSYTVAYETLPDTDSEAERAKHASAEKVNWRLLREKSDKIKLLNDEERADVVAARQDIFENIRVNAAPQHQQLRPYQQMLQHQQLSRHKQQQQALKQKLRQQRNASAQDFDTGAEYCDDSSSSGLQFSSTSQPSTSATPVTATAATAAAAAAVSSTAAGQRSSGIVTSFSNYVANRQHTVHQQPMMYQQPVTTAAMSGGVGVLQHQQQQQQQQQEVQAGDGLLVLGLVQPDKRATELHRVKVCLQCTY
jgi:hypothetical protein